MDICHQTKDFSFPKSPSCFLAEHLGDKNQISLLFEQRGKLVENKRNRGDHGITKIIDKFFFYQITLSFLVYDRDNNWQSKSDDFMGSCNVQLSLVSMFIPS